MTHRRVSQHSPPTNLRSTRVLRCCSLRDSGSAKELRRAILAPSFNRCTQTSDHACHLFLRSLLSSPDFLRSSSRVLFAITIISLLAVLSPLFCLSLARLRHRSTAETGAYELRLKHGQKGASKWISARQEPAVWSVDGSETSHHLRFLSSSARRQ